MNDSILRQLNELESLASKYREELEKLRIEVEAKSNRILVNRVLSLLTIINEITPKLISIQNQINHEQKNYHNSNDIRRNPNQSNSAEVAGDSPT